MKAVDALRRRGERAAERAPPATTLARLGLGLMLLLAGIHKLLDPDAWAAYVVGWLAPLLVVTPVQFMLLNGWLEIAFGLLLLVDRYTAVAATVAAVSLTATAGYLAIVWATTSRFGDVLARDVGLAALAWAVLVDALHHSES